MQASQAQGFGIHNMANHLQTYTALQCLLFFQTLAAHRPDSNAFAQVAQHLRSSSLFTQGIVGDDSTSLNPESLHDLYDRTVNTVSKTPPPDHGTSNNTDATNGDKSRQDAPGATAAKLVPMLYEDYRRRIIEDIRGEERKYTRLVREVASLETTDAETIGKVEQRPLSDAQPSSVPSGMRAAQQDISAPVKSSQSIEHPEKPSVQDKSHPRRANASIDSIINHDEPSEERFARPSTAGSGAVPTPTFPHPELPYGVPHAQHNAPSIHPAPGSVRRDSRGAHDMRQMPSPGSAGALQHMPSQSPTAPVILPPPPGMNPPPFPPTSPYSPHADHAMSSAYRGHGAPYTGHPYTNHDPYGSARYPEPYPSSQYGQHDARRPPLGSQPQTRHTYPHYQSQNQSPTYANAAQAQQAQRGGVVLPPFQITPQAASPPLGAQPTRAVAAQFAQTTQTKRIPDRLQIHDQGVRTPTQAPAMSARPTPLSAPHTAYLHFPGLSTSPGSTTVWRNPSNVKYRERSPPRSISPLTDRESIPVPSKPVAGGRGRRGKAAKATDQKQTGRSSLDRSPSASSHMSEPITSKGTAKGNRRIKHEPPSTPLASTNGNDADITNTAQSLKRGQSAKRKRADSDTAEMAPLSSIAVTPATLKAPDTLVAYRNFGRMAQPVMNVIQSHKHASLFAEPVRERQAEGYRDIIRRPQDLKSIRTAIAAGSRAVAAALDAQQMSPGSTAGSASGNAVILSVSEALVPPRGIVNAAQLEQEVMRMFANAVMFNPGDDEIVQDSREMFDSVEQALQQWRDVERMEETDDMPREDAEAITGSAKRRRL